MNVGHIGTLSSVHLPAHAGSGANTAKLANSQAVVAPQNPIAADSVAQQESTRIGSVSRINDPLNPSQTSQVDDRPQQPSSQSAVRLTSESAQSDRQLQAQVKQLAAIDREVRNHEAAHAAAGGGLTGAPSYQYTRGPDGQLYATSGEVDINTNQSADPLTNIQNARTVLKAALAPASPSSQDLRVAAQARAQLIDAQAELNRQELKASEEEGQPDMVFQSEPDRRLVADVEREKDESPDDSVQKNQDQLQQRQARIREKQLEFAQEMAELNLRIQKVQQQLIETGQVDPSSLLQGTLVDTQA